MGVGFTKRLVESAELQLSPLENKLGKVAPRGPSSDAFGVLQLSILIKSIMKAFKWFWLDYVSGRRA